MNDNIKESLSALVDGEVDELELRRILKALENEDEAVTSESSLLHRWSRYHLMSAAMKNESTTICDDGFLANINAVLDGHANEERVVEPMAKTSPMTSGVREQVSEGVVEEKIAPSHWSRFAVAASVALAVVVGVSQWRSVDEDSAAVTSVAVVDRPVMTPNVSVNAVAATAVQGTLRSPTVAASGAPSIVLDEASPYSTQELALAQRRLNDYLLRHAKQASQKGGRGALPYARLTTYEVE